MLYAIRAMTVHLPAADPNAFMVRERRLMARDQKTHQSVSESAARAAPPTCGQCSVRRSAPQVPTCPWRAMARLRALRVHAGPAPADASPRPAPAHGGGFSGKPA